MVGKQTTGKSFGGCVRYIVQKPEAVILDACGVRMQNTKSMTEDFNLQRKMNPELGKVVGHIALSWSPDDLPKLTAKIMAERAKEYLEKMNIRNTQYLMVRHQDKNHPHVHIIYNRVDNNGTTIPNYNLWKKNQKVCKELTLKYGYHFGKGKEQVNRQALRGKEKIRYELYDAIKASLNQARSWKQLETLLAEKGIGLQYKYRRGTEEVQGISFSKGEMKFKGSAIDRSLSFKKLNEQLDRNSRQLQLKNAPQISVMQEIVQFEKSVQLEGASRHIGAILSTLLQPEYNISDNTGSMEEEIKKRKKKKHQYKRQRL